MAKATKKVEEKTKKEFTLEEVFSMWKKAGKTGTTYFTGKYKGEELRGFYNSKKKNPNEPDVKIYTVSKEGELSKEPILVLWCNATEKGKKYLSGKIVDSRVVGFINEKATEENKRPYFTVYFSDDKKEEKVQVEEVTEDQLPF